MSTLNLEILTTDFFFLFQTKKIAAYLGNVFLPRIKQKYVRYFVGSEVDSNLSSRQMWRAVERLVEAHNFRRTLILPSYKDTTEGNYTLIQFK